MALLMQQNQVQQVRFGATKLTCDAYLQSRDEIPQNEDVRYARSEATLMRRAPIGTTKISPLLQSSDEMAREIFAANTDGAFIFLARERSLPSKATLSVTDSSAYHLASPAHWPRCRLKAATKLNHSSSREFICADP